jgi:hypothetical protein
LGALATWAVPLTFDNNVDVASYYLLVPFLFRLVERLATLLAA